MPYSKALSRWLLLGCILVVIQIIIGGVTRLTDSGLSITEWKVITGSLPPLNDSDWLLAYDKYKTIAKKQYESLHMGMTVDEFKVIFFWEYFHRLWARIMFFVFTIPFIYFLIKKQVSARLLKQLGCVIILATIAAVFGWYMVASGLNNDKRTWVSAYNLLSHLLIAVFLFSVLVYTYIDYTYKEQKEITSIVGSTLWKFIGGLILIQMALGALMAGMRAGLVLPYAFILPKYSVIIDVFSSSPSISIDNLYDYEPNPSLKIIVQLLHRSTAYTLLFLALFFAFKNRRLIPYTKGISFFIFMLFSQMILGILTVSYCQGRVPIALGAIHQIVAFFVIASYLWVYYTAKKR